MTTLNPAWVAYNNANNEGGEGFNPHAKFLTATGSLGAPSGERMIPMLGHKAEYAHAMDYARLCLSGDKNTAFIAQVNSVFGV